MYTVTFLNNKGGVGKSAAVISVGHMLATECGKRVLLIDMDPQANTSQMFGFEGDSNYSLKEILQGNVYPVKDTVEDILWDKEKDIQDCIYATDYNGLDIIPSFITLCEMENRLIVNITEPNQFRLYKQLEKIQDKYDFCLIDCGPSVSLLNVNALAASDTVYIPSRCDKSSRIGIANVLRMVKNIQDFSRKKLEFGGCFLVQYDERRKICKEAWLDCKEALGDKLLPVTIPTCTKVEQTSSLKKPILELDPRGKITQSFRELTQHIIETANKTT